MISPSSHSPRQIFERAVIALVFSSGASVGFYQGDVMKLFDDIQNLRPTMFPSVPRLFNRLYEKVNATIEQAGGTSKTLYDWAYSAKKEKLDSGVNPEHGLWDTVVFSKLRAKLGGRVRFIVTGSAPISANVFQFLQMCAPSTRAHTARSCHLFTSYHTFTYHSRVSCTNCHDTRRTRTHVVSAASAAPFCRATASLRPPPACA